MAPSQVSIDPDPKKKPVIVGKTLVTQEDKDMRCVINRQDTPFVSSDQKVPAPFATESMGVDIVECTDSTDIRMAEADEPNATECSSSFSDTGSGTDDGSKLSDAEVESRFSFGNDIDSNLFDEFVSLFPARKKKLTAQWRDYIHPLMWRCKWIELRIKELQSQSLKYDRELAYYDRRKQQELGKVSDTRSSPFGVQNYKKKVMKRRKRNRIEDKVDISSYMSHHNLFSYYECKRSDAEGASVDEVFSGDIKKNDDGGIKDACPSGEFGDDQNPLEKVIFDIERMQCRVKKLKIQIDELLTVHVKKISSMENMSLPVQSDLPSNSAQSPVSSPRNGDTVPIGALPQHIPEYDVRDLLMLDGVSAGEPTPDIIESTVQMLLKPQNGDLPEPIVDEVLINNQKAEENLNDFERITGMLTENMFQEVVKEEPQERDVPLVPDPKPDTTCQDTQIAQEQHALKSSLASDFIAATNKRKRDQRKARSGVWKADNIFSQPSVGKNDNE